MNCYYAKCSHVALEKSELVVILDNARYLSQSWSQVEFLGCVYPRDIIEFFQCPWTNFHFTESEAWQSPPQWVHLSFLLLRGQHLSAQLQTDEDHVCSESSPEDILETQPLIQCQEIPFIKWFFFMPPIWNLRLQLVSWLCPLRDEARFSYHTIRTTKTFSSLPPLLYKIVSSSFTFSHWYICTLSSSWGLEYP